VSEELLRRAYEAFNARDLDAALALMHRDVDWPNAIDGGRVRGVLLWNVWGQVDAARALIAEPGPFDAGRLRGRLAG